MEESVPDEISRELREALRDVEEMLAERDAEFADVSEQLSRLVQALVSLRDHVAGAQRAGKRVALPPLEEINGMISVVVSIEYPRSGIRWSRLADVQRHLAGLVASRPLQ